LKFIKQFKEFIGNQYSHPTGLLGMYIGEKMVRQHEPETLWTIKILELQHNENILELGCGAGYAMKLILEQPAVTQVVGLDLSESVLRSASIRNRNDIRKGRARLVKSDVNNLEFQNESFSKVFSIHSLYFWDNLPKTISEIYRLLKHEGITVLTLCDGKNGETWDDIKTLIEQQVVPSMNQIGFKNIQILNGPNSREFHTVSIKAVK
jgi:ubiquinone/menaquinone biosynthesis C-methylase UbiE